MIAALLLVVLAQAPSAPPAPPAAVVAARAAINTSGTALVTDALATFDADADGLVRALQARSFDVEGPRPRWIVATRVREGATRTIGFCILLGEADASIPEPARITAAPLDRSARFKARTLPGRFEFAALLAAVDALDAAQLMPDANLVVVLDESRHLLGNGPAGAELPSADAWFVFAGHSYPSARATLAFGARGHVDVRCVVFGATRAVDASAFGGLAPNPALVLAMELAAMRDDRGNVLIRGFYDDLADSPDAALIAQANDASDEIDSIVPQWLGTAELELQGATLGTIAMRPALDVVGMGTTAWGAPQDPAPTDSILSQAYALLRLSTIEGQSRTRAVERVHAHLVERGWLVLDREPTLKERAEHWRIAKLTTRDEGFDARRTRLDHPIVKPMFDALFAIEQRPPVVMPQLGDALDLGWLTLQDGGAYVVLPHGLAGDGAPRDDNSVGAWFACMQACAAALEVGGRD